MSTYRSASGSSAEDLFIELFSDTFGAEKAGYLYSQYPCLLYTSCSSMSLTLTR